MTNVEHGPDFWNHQPLQWRHKQRHGVSITSISKKTSMLNATGLCKGNRHVAGGFLLTKGQQRGKCFHWMTSSCNTGELSGFYYEYFGKKPTDNNMAELHFLSDIVSDMCDHQILERFYERCDLVPTFVAIQLRIHLDWNDWIPKQSVWYPEQDNCVWRLVFVYLLQSYLTVKTTRRRYTMTSWYGNAFPVIGPLVIHQSSVDSTHKEPVNGFFLLTKRIIATTEL